MKDQRVCLSLQERFLYPMCWSRSSAAAFPAWRTPQTGSGVALTCLRSWGTAAAAVLDQYPRLCCSDCSGFLGFRYHFSTQQFERWERGKSAHLSAWLLLTLFRGNLSRPDGFQRSRDPELTRLLISLMFNKMNVVKMSTKLPQSMDIFLLGWNNSSPT